MGRILPGVIATCSLRFPHQPEGLLVTSRRPDWRTRNPTAAATSASSPLLLSRRREKHGRRSSRISYDDPVHRSMTPVLLHQHSVVRSSNDTDVRHALKQQLSSCTRSASQQKRERRQKQSSATRKGPPFAAAQTPSSNSSNAKGSQTHAEQNAHTQTHKHTRTDGVARQQTPKSIPQSIDHSSTSKRHPSALHAT